MLWADKEEAWTTSLRWSHLPKGCKTLATLATSVGLRARIWGLQVENESLTDWFLPRQLFGIEFHMDWTYGASVPPLELTDNELRQWWWPSGRVTFITTERSKEEPQLLQLDLLPLPYRNRAEKREGYVKEKTTPPRRQMHTYASTHLCTNIYTHTHIHTCLLKAMRATVACTEVEGKH